MLLNSRLYIVTGLMCVLNRGNTEETNSSKILCLMSVCVLFYVDLCRD